MFFYDRIGILKEQLDEMYEMVLTGEFPLTEFLEKLHYLNPEINKGAYYIKLARKGFITKKEAEKCLEKSLRFDENYMKIIGD